MPSVQTRRAGPADVSAIVDIGERGWRAAYGDILAAETIDAALSEWYDPAFVGRAVDSEQVGYFVAERDETVLGFASVGPSGEDAAVASLRSIYVDPDYWGEGAGTALLDRAELYCWDHGFDAVRVRVLTENDAGRSFYRGRGYEPVTETETDLFGETVAETVLRGSLD